MAKAARKKPRVRRSDAGKGPALLRGSVGYGPEHLRDANGSLRPEGVLALRLVAGGLMHRDAAAVVHRTERVWSRWESSGKQHSPPDEALVELFCLKRRIPYPPVFNLEECMSLYYRPVQPKAPAAEPDESSS